MISLLCNSDVLQLGNSRLHPIAAFPLPLTSLCQAAREALTAESRTKLEKSADKAGSGRMICQAQVFVNGIALHLELFTPLNFHIALSMQHDAACRLLAESQVPRDSFLAEATIMSRSPKLETFSHDLPQVIVVQRHKPHKRAECGDPK